MQVSPSLQLLLLIHGIKVAFTVPRSRRHTHTGRRVWLCCGRHTHHPIARSPLVRLLSLSLVVVPSLACQTRVQAREGERESVLFCLRTTAAVSLRPVSLSLVCSRLVASTCAREAESFEPGLPTHGETSSVCLIWISETGSCVWISPAYVYSGSPLACLRSSLFPFGRRSLAVSTAFPETRKAGNRQEGERDTAS